MSSATIERLLRIRGTVQGVGFRPFVARVARRLGVTGWVKNDGDGVLVQARGNPVQLEALAAAIADRPPPAARVAGLEWISTGDPAGLAGDGFIIAESDLADDAIGTDVPVDLAPCPDCRRELASPDDRRHDYPFINCTQCGPRYSILERLPYDRQRTTMACFQMCPDCAREYHDPHSRRFHAEPNACPVCGPQLRLTDAAGRTIADRQPALERAALALPRGEIVAVKGVGGFHLLLDAQNETAVRRLRELKHREQKPLAVMFRDLRMVESWLDVPAAAAERLLSPAAPIVLLPRRAGCPVAPSVAPDNPWLGALLPPSPLHVQLLALVNRPLVATSGNLSDEPLCVDDAEARARLGCMASLFLGHNRSIVRPVDDSVVRFTRTGECIVLRQARGQAPTTLRLPSAVRCTTIAVGAQMKNTVALASGDRVVLSPHIGDLEGVPAHLAFARTIEMLRGLLQADIAAVACDKHPDYASTRWAEKSGLPRVRVQHHLAHVLAVLLERHHAADDVLGLAWDGTGYGEDGTVWGGEFILLRNGTAERCARLRPFRLPGGDAAARDPRRSAWSVLQTAGLPDVAAQRLGFSAVEQTALHTMVERGLNSPACSSIGRLFDAVGALLRLSSRNAFEGQTPMSVEIAALKCRAVPDALPFAICPAAHHALWEIDWRPAIEGIVDDRRHSPAELAAAFHHGLAHAAAEIARRADVANVVLSGGCFQNALLRDLVETRLQALRFRVLTPRELPSNDGAIAAGQALAAAWNLHSVQLPRPANL